MNPLSMQARMTVKWAIYGFSCLAVAYPLWVRFENVGIRLEPSNLFPFFGLAAFSLLWLHSISGVFEKRMRQFLDFDGFVQVTSLMILACLVLHPLLLLLMLGFRFQDVFLFYGTLPVYLGIAGWILLATYDIWKPLTKVHPFFATHWNKILIISNVGFLLTFFHSVQLGSDLQAGPLRAVWIFYGVTAFLSIGYTYFVKPWLPKSPE